MRTKMVIGLMGLAAVAGTAMAEDLSPVVLFGQKYRVQRFDYSTVTWADPINPGFDLQLIQVEGSHSLGNDRLLLSTDSLEDLLSLKNWVVEIQLARNDFGEITGLEYVRTVLINDPSDENYGGFDLSPCGVTVNSGPTGLSAGGDLLIADSESNAVAAYTISGGVQTGSFSGGVENDSFDDLAYVPTNDRVYTINEDAGLLVSFTTSGAYVASTPIPGMVALDETAVAGSAKGMCYLADADTVPAAIRSSSGSILLTLDDNNPGLQVVDTLGNVLATEPLTDDAVLGGNSILDQGSSCGNPLQLEAAAFDAATGTIFLINESDLTDCAGFYVLTPACGADFDNSGFVDTDDYDAFVQSFENGTDDADFDNSGFVDTDDFDAFVQAFESGC